jgi:hypothetical protein
MMNFCACAAIDELVIFHLLHPSSCGLLDAAKAKHELPPREKWAVGVSLRKLELTSTSRTVTPGMIADI